MHLPQGNLRTRIPERLNSKSYTALWGATPPKCKLLLLTKKSFLPSAQATAAQSRVHLVFLSRATPKGHS